MNKPFLLIAGYGYYPGAGTEDWQDRFETYEEAARQIETIQHYREITKGKRKGEREETYKRYIYNGNKFDWYQIVNIEEWSK